MGWRASRAERDDNHTDSASARVLSVRSACTQQGKARTRRAPRRLHAVMTMFRSRRCRPGAVSVKKCLGQRHGMERVARRPRRQPRHVSSARVLRGPSDCSPRAKRMVAAHHRGCMRRPRPLRSRSRRPGAVSVKKSLGQRHLVGRVAHWPRRQQRQVRQSARAPWADGRLSAGRKTRGSRGTGVKCGDHDVSKPKPPIWGGVDEEEPWSTAWGGARRALGVKTTMPSPPARACAIGRRPVLHGAKRVRVAWHESQAL